MNKKAPTPTLGTTVQLPVNVHQQLNIECSERQMSKKAMMIDALQLYWELVPRPNHRGDVGNTIQTAAGIQHSDALGVTTDELLGRAIDKKRDAS